MRYSCLLRGINVSGQRKIKMVELRDLCASLGFQKVEHYLQSGNIILDSDLSAAEVNDKLTQGIRSEFGYSDVDVMVLDARELEDIIRKNPFQGPEFDSSKLYFTYLKEPPDIALSSLLDPEEFLPDVFSFGSSEIYVYCPGGYGRTKLNNAYFERKLKVRSTTRNCKTTEKLFQLTRV